MAAVAGVYRRTLPSPPAIEFASPPGKKLFAEALANGNMEGFFKLISYYQTQSEPAYCGLATLTMVLNALSIDPGRKWKGPWRWFDDSMLDCCEPLEKVKVNGISFDKVACLALCNGAEVNAFRTNESTIESFRKYVSSCTSSSDCHIIVSYHRGHLKQTGSGHFSPIGGFHAGNDMVLILDVARFKYPPHWVPLTLLWDAMNTIDNDTGLYRGFMLLSRVDRAPSILYTVSCHVDCNLAIKYLTESIPHLLASDEITDIQDILSAVFTSAPTDLTELVNWVVEVRKSEDRSKLLSEEEKGRLALKENLLKQVQETELFKYVLRWVCSGSCVSSASEVCQSSFHKIASEVCCQGAQLLCGKTKSCDTACSKSSKSESSNTDNLESTTTSSGRVIVANSELGVEMLVPCCQGKPDRPCESCLTTSRGEHPHIHDILTVLILALPPGTWSCLKDQKLREEFSRMVSTDDLPDMLQQEVLHLRRQLQFVTADLLQCNPRCQA